MSTLVLVFHSDMEQSKVNKGLKAAAQEVDSITVRDLYELYPDFQIDVKREQEELLKHDHIVLQFPMYWYHGPALLKEWLDVVLVHGFAYGSKGKYLLGKTMDFAVSTGSPLKDYQKDGKQEYTVMDYLLPLRQTVRYSNMTYGQPFLTGGGLTISNEEVAQQAEAYQAYLSALNQQ